MEVSIMKWAKHSALACVLSIFLLGAICKGKVEVTLTENSGGTIEPGKELWVHFPDSTEIKAKDHGRIVWTDFKNKEGKLDFQYEEEKDTVKVSSGTVDPDPPHNSHFAFTFQDNYGIIQGQTIVAPISGTFSGLGNGAGTVVSLDETIHGSSYDPFCCWEGKSAVLGEFTITTVIDSPITFSVDTVNRMFSIDFYEYLHSDNLFIVDTTTGEPEPLLMSVHGEGTYVFTTGDIPTLTEWGMIIFGVLLFGWMAWVIVRRRRRVTISA
jgi:hypothetical protein